MNARGISYLVAAGAVAGLATLAKSEMGLAAVGAGIAAALLAAFPNVKRSLALAGIFFVTTAAVVVPVYALIASIVGWRTLTHDSFLFFQNVPPELVYFNRFLGSRLLPLRWSRDSSLHGSVGAGLS